MRVLAVDPGGHVGVATWDDGVWKAWEAHPADVQEFAEAWVGWADVVVCEGFNISGQRARDSNLTIEMIGVLRYWSTRLGRTFVEQSPGDASAFGTAAKLKRLGWWTKGSDHARSASKHLLLHLVKSGQLSAADVLPSDTEEGGAA